MKILLTGSSGLIGKRVLQLLTKIENVTIILANRNNYFNVNDLNTNTKFIKFDLNSINLNINYFDFFEHPDIMIHLAWQGLPNYDDNIHLVQCDKHFSFLKNLVDNGLKKIVITGTCLEYGLIEGELFEDSPSNPITKYGIAKLKLFNLLNNYIRNKSINLIWLRLFYNYGFHIENSSIVSKLIKSIINNKEDFEMSTGEQERDFLNIDILSYYILKISFQEKITGIINCCSGKPQKVIDLVENIKEIYSSKITLKKGIYPIPNYEPYIFFGSNLKLLTAIQ
jgi:nucleoside-diphosphate-sugar epimerase